MATSTAVDLGRTSLRSRPRGGRARRAAGQRPVSPSWWPDLHITTVIQSLATET
ncbi:unnamed protein product [Spirodela intermedia]|uniref:Uncharacterized protein n=2 Tax=Spirodela intermedia TaxID=51605 RepID=A0A7I8KJ34_SPIIN|nr:unnamed protein product [Spirodela intermedia]CAA6661368.1 unnamed protein product [Spirodela intermedia]CAA7397730.1 unnamed protein product [Spirodela intermedia]